MAPEYTGIQDNEQNRQDRGKPNENNYVEIAGIADSEPVFSHEVYGEKFYTFSVSVKRLSEQYDILPVLYSERLMIEPNMLKAGRRVMVYGQFRSYNNVSSKEKNRLTLTVFAREIILPGDDEEFTDINNIYIDGYICKPPIYRTTPFGREISDLLVAVNRAYNKSDYIPCIAWGRNARYCEKLGVGLNIRIWGRIQSRVYQKRYSENEIVDRVAYEISIARLELSD